MSPLPVDLVRAMERGELSRAQLRQLIELEAHELGLSLEEALNRARTGTLPASHIGADLGLLIALLPAAA